MSDKRDWVYARLLRVGTFALPRQPYWLGWVEFTPMRLLGERDFSSISTSLTTYGLPEVVREDHLHVVARTLVLDVHALDAQTEGEARLREATDLLRTKVSPLQQEFSMSPAGFLVDILDDVTTLLRPPGQGPQWTFGLRDDRASLPSYAINLLLVAPNAYGELGAAYLRSLHWLHVAGEATTVSQRILLTWMASETLCSVTVGADPIPNLMAVAGFPIGQRSRLAGPVQRIVRRHSTWSRRSHSLLTTTKLARNGIVHEGYRDVEVRQQMPSADERDLLIFLRCALVSLHEHTEYVLANGAAPLARLWDDGSLSDDSMQKRAAWTVQCLEGEHDRFAK